MNRAPKTCNRACTCPVGSNDIGNCTPGACVVEDNNPTDTRMPHLCWVVQQDLI